MPKRKKLPGESAATGDRLTIRLDLAGGFRIGPGKIAVLGEIARSGSISAAGRVLCMSYRRTWERVEDPNKGLGLPVAETAAGGSGGGGPTLARPEKRSLNATVRSRWTRRQPLASIYLHRTGSV